MYRPGLSEAVDPNAASHEFEIGRGGTAARGLATPIVSRPERRILLVGPLPRRGATDRLPWLQFTAAALRALGHRVSIESYRDSWASSPRLRGWLSPGNPAIGIAEEWARRMEQRRDWRLVRRARRLRPDLVIVLKGEVFSRTTLEEVRAHLAGPMVTWWVDAPTPYPDAVAALSVFDHVFLFDRSYIDDLARQGIERTSYLPCACDPAVYRPRRLSGAQRRALECGVAFVGTYDPARARLVRVIAERVDVGVWGTGWLTAASRAELGSAAPVRGGAIGPDMASLIYSAARVGLNSHHPQTRNGGLNMRTFELLAAGCLPLVDYVPGMEELLEPDRDLACYRSEEEAVEHAARFAADRDAATALVQSGRARVVAEHTYVSRMRSLIETVS